MQAQMEAMKKEIEGQVADVALIRNLGPQRSVTELATKLQLITNLQQQQANALQTEITKLQAELQGCKTELQGCKTELQGCKTELQGCKTELQGYKAEHSLVLKWTAELPAYDRANLETLANHGDANAVLHLAIGQFAFGNLGLDVENGRKLLQKYKGRHEVLTLVHEWWINGNSDAFKKLRDRASAADTSVANACRMVCFFSKQKSSKGIHHTATDQQLTAAEAQGYLESGAKAGHPPCQARLAKSKETTDPEGSHDLYVLAAHHQWAFAENAVGTYNYTMARKAREAGNYSHAEIWSQHAAEWFSKAALQGNAYGQNNLARCYERGEGVVLDLGKAQKFYSLSAAQGWQDAVTNLARVNAKIHHHQNNKQ